MLKLSPRADAPAHLTLIPGVTVSVRPVTVAAMIGARAEAGKVFRVEVADTDASPGVADPELRTEVSIALVCALARFAITAWEGAGPARAPETGHGRIAMMQIGWRGRVTVAWHILGCGLLILACVVAGGTAGAITGGEKHWPYDVRVRELVTPQVAPDAYLIMRRVIDYHQDCEIRYERRIQSTGIGGRRFIPPDLDFEHPPWDRSGKPQEMAIKLPENFPCGPAYLVESVSTACNFVQRTFRRLRKPDIITPFVVACPVPG